MSTWYLMHRGWMDNPVIARYWCHPYSRREAWIWMIENAAWEDHNAFSRGQKIEIKRGQIPTTVRKLMKEWRWSQGKVARFISDLENDNMVVRNTDTGFYIITICKYEQFQNPRNITDTQTDDKSIPNSGTQTGANSNKENNLKKENNIPPTPASGGQRALITDLPKQRKEPSRFVEFWAEYPRKDARKTAEAAYEKARERDSQENIIAGVKAMRRRFDNDDRDKADKLKFCKYAQGWLNGDRWRDYIDAEPDEDDEEMPKNMTPEEHAKWCARRLGLWQIQ